MNCFDSHSHSVGFHLCITCPCVCECHWQECRRPLLLLSPTAACSTPATPTMNPRPATSVCRTSARRASTPLRQSNQVGQLLLLLLLQFKNQTGCCSVVLNGAVNEVLFRKQRDDGKSKGFQCLFKVQVKSVQHIYSVWTKKKTHKGENPQCSCIDTEQQSALQA